MNISNFLTFQKNWDIVFLADYGRWNIYYNKDSDNAYYNPKAQLISSLSITKFWNYILHTKFSKSYFLKCTLKFLNDFFKVTNFFLEIFSGFLDHQKWGNQQII